MLKISKKTVLQPELVESHIKSQKQKEKQVQNLLNSDSHLVQTQLLKILKDATSINAQQLAHLIYRLIKEYSRSHYDQLIDLVLFLYQLPHDQKELRYWLKSKFKIEPKLFLLLLLKRRDQANAINLASLVIDCYTLTLMLDGQEVIKLWKEHIQHLAACLKAKQEILSLLGQEKKDSKQNGFKTISIPL